MFECVNGRPPARANDSCERHLNPELWLRRLLARFQAISWTGAEMAGAQHEGCANGVGMAAEGRCVQRIDSDANLRPLTGISDSGSLGFGRSLGFSQSAHAPAHRRADRRAKTFAQAAWS
jgi:hypothetical protein